MVPVVTRGPYRRNVSQARQQLEWQPVCPLAELEIERGALALVHGQAVALFRVDETTVHALADHDPYDRHATLARGIVGRDGDVPFVASPGHKYAFDLRTGQSLDDPRVRLTTYDVKVADGVVLVGPRKPVATDVSPPAPPRE
jgi:nitrite reductase (NADH) small subunit